MRKPLFSVQRYLQRRTEVTYPTQRSRGKREWVLARSLCHYRLISLEDVPLAKRDSVLQLHIKQWSPFQDYASYPVWYSNGLIQVWIWDKKIQQEQMNQLGLKKVVAIPETVLRPRSSIDTVQLIQCLEGVEAQIWQQGLLKASRWWAQMPSLTDWIQFQRTHNLPIQTTLPEPIESPLLARPWGKPRTNIAHFGAAQETTLVMVALSILACIFTWQSVSLWQWYQATQQLQQQIDQFTDRVEPLLQARNEAINYKQRIDELMRLNPYPSQLEVVHQVLAQLPHNDKTKLLEWLYQAGELRITLESDKLDPTFYVKTFQKLPQFTNVSAELGSGRNANQIFINMQLVTKL